MHRLVRRPRLCAAFTAVAALCIATPALAAQITDVRVGVHPKFTRIVFELDGRAGYQVERAGTDAAPELRITIEATSGMRQVRGNGDVRGVKVDAGTKARAQIALRQPGLRVHEWMLSDPPRIVIDIHKPESAVAATAKPAAQPKAAAKETPKAEPAPKVVAKEPKPAPAPKETPKAEPAPKVIAKDEPKPAPAPKAAPAPQPAPEAPKAAVAPPAPPPAPKAVAPAPPVPPVPDPAVAPAPRVAPAPSETAKAVEPAPPTREAPPKAAAAPPAPAPTPGVPPAVVPPAPHEPTPDSVAKPPAPMPPAPPAAPPPGAVRPKPAPAPIAPVSPAAGGSWSSRLTSDPIWIGAIAAALLVAAAIALVLHRRRALPNDLDVTAIAEEIEQTSDAPGRIPSGGFAMGDDSASAPATPGFAQRAQVSRSGPQASEAHQMGEPRPEDTTLAGLFDRPAAPAPVWPAPPPSARPAPTPESTPSAAAAEDSLFDDAGEQAGEPDVSEGDAPMNQEMDLPVDRHMSPPAARMGGSAASSPDIARMLQDFERRIATLEARLDESNEAREKLERQVAAQSEELRVQRAAIARTQRALRTMTRGDEDKATEPALRDGDTQAKTRVTP